MNDRLGNLGRTTRLTVDVSIRKLSPDIILGGSPPRLIRFRAGTSMGTRLAVAEGITASELAPRTLRRLLDAGVLHPDPTTLVSVADQLLTVVIPIHNRADLLDRALTALGHRFRVLVVDDASTNPHQLDEIAALHQAEIVHLTVNLGPAGARNAGLAEVETTFVAFVDSDVVATPEALSMLIRHFADPDVAAVAPRVRALPGTSKGGFIERFEAQRPPLDMGEFPATVRPATRVAYVPTACLVARTAAVRPGFDESLRTGEDVDLVWRLGQQGWLVRYEPSVDVRHSSRQGAAAWVRQHYGYGLSASPLQHRHGDAVAPARMPLWAAVMVTAVWTAASTYGSRRSGGRAVIVALAVALGATVVGHVQTREALRTIAPEAREHAGLLTATTATVSLEQSLSLLLRHWVPLSLVGGLFVPRARLLLGMAALINAWRANPKSLADFTTTLAGNAVVESAYGMGVWSGMLRERDIRAVVPTVTAHWGKGLRTETHGTAVKNSPGSSASLPNWFEMDAKKHFEAQLATRRFPKGARALQLGAYTGDASVWLMENTSFTLTDVDTWQGSDEQAHAELDWAEVEATYDRRTAQFRADGQDLSGKCPRIRKVKLPSARFLRDERATYSFVYIDAAHDATSVLADAMLALPLLASGSILAFDDYVWDLGETPLDNPRAGIDRFLDIYRDRFITLQLDTQVWLQLK